MNIAKNDKVNGKIIARLEKMNIVCIPHLLEADPLELHEKLGKAYYCRVFDFVKAQTGKIVGSLRKVA